jgi:hypothetical protein
MNECLLPRRLRARMTNVAFTDLEEIKRGD